MNVESQPKLPGPALPPRQRTSRVVLWLGFGGAATLLLTIILLFVLAAREQRPVWLSSTEPAQNWRPGPFAPLKQKLVKLMPSFVWRFWRTKPIISITANLLTLPATAVDQTGLRTPVATNADGILAWILSPTELSVFRQQLQTIPGVDRLGSPGVTVFSGRQAQVQVVDTVQVQGKPTPVGLVVNLLPRASAGSINLAMSATSTEPFVPQPGGALEVRTNLAAACRVFIPNAGGLVLGSGNAKDADGKSNWLIVSPTAVDAKGNPIKL